MNKIPMGRLPFWMRGRTTQQLHGLFQQFYQRTLERLLLVLNHRDVETCDPILLDLIAWHRGIVRFQAEPEHLFRKRVKHAYANARDAGSTIGFQRIFERLGVGFVELAERTPDKDWDVVVLRITNEGYNEALLNFIIQTYGRTCRRYEYAYLSELPQSIRLGATDYQQTICEISL